MKRAQRKSMADAAPLQRYSEQTITDPELLRQELDQIAESGIGVENEENLPGTVALAVPVFNTQQEICFSLAVHAPKARKPLEKLRKYIPSMKRAAIAMVL